MNVTVAGTFDDRVARALHDVFGAASSPWRQLGALAFHCLVLAIASGIVAYALYDTSLDGAYQSGLRLERDPSGLGVLLRGLHRYSADAFVAFTALHLGREFLRGHFRGARGFTWLTGVPAVWLGWIAGLTGLWLLWDARALYSAGATAEWLQALPLAGEALSRNFLSAGELSDRFFSLVMFLHIGVPLLLLGVLWSHLQRLRHAALWPSRRAMMGLTGVLCLLAFAWPTRSLGIADTGFVPARLPIDWFFQFPHPVAEMLSAPAAWWLAAAATLLLLALPWWPDRRTRADTPAAAVTLAQCNGCARCVADCPTGAIHLAPRSDGRRHPFEARVDANLCTRCGVCVGACPSATPFRRIEELVSGIELPAQPVDALRERLRAGLARTDAAMPVVAFTCRDAVAPTAAAGPVITLAIECAGMLPPSFIDYTLRQRVAGVVIAGCRRHDCEYRLGDRWTSERIAGMRAPALRAAVPRIRLAVTWCSRDAAMLDQAISALHAIPVSTPRHDAGVPS